MFFAFYLEFISSINGHVIKECSCINWTYSNCQISWKSGYCGRLLPLSLNCMSWKIQSFNKHTQCVHNIGNFVKKNRTQKTKKKKLKPNNDWKFANSPFNDCEFRTKQRSSRLFFLTTSSYSILSYGSKIPTLSDTFGGHSALYVNLMYANHTHHCIDLFSFFLSLCISLFCRIFRFCCRFFGLRHTHTNSYTHNYMPTSNTAYCRSMRPIFTRSHTHTQ